MQPTMAEKNADATIIKMAPRAATVNRWGLSWLSARVTQLTPRGQSPIRRLYFTHGMVACEPGAVWLPSHSPFIQHDAEPRMDFSVSGDKKALIHHALHMSTASAIFGSRSVFSDLTLFAPGRP